ncbi:hypothetical protein A11A3_09385 [Alcanivorax hongdengensis A-11-3]|uniref:Uncharacterized protein n=1 Tax=Alcanivorax hongdengensis A-11-3 TaxID=1177179 RepID=L0WB51_9GAMM|nr:hypothetical protein A11A3_09385 [Alcanivorax hongdengensis A-11-3]
MLMVKVPARSLITSMMKVVIHLPMVTSTAVHLIAIPALIQRLLTVFAIAAPLMNAMTLVVGTAMVTAFLTARMQTLLTPMRTVTA